MADICKMFGEISQNLKRLSEDIGKIDFKKNEKTNEKDIEKLEGYIEKTEEITEEKTEEKVTKTKQRPSFKSLSKLPSSILRKSKEDVIKAQENPEITFIFDQLEKIFK